jgi:hypothetical protein
VTSYLVLTRNKDHDGAEWTERDIVEASSEEAAKRNWYMRHTPQEVVAIVAVPARSWKPQPVRVESKPRIVLGGPEKPQEATE